MNETREFLEAVSDRFRSVPLIALTVTFHVWFMRNAYKAVLKYMAVRGQFDRP